jgi:hypothetical protein
MSMDNEPTRPIPPVAATAAEPPAAAAETPPAAEPTAAGPTAAAEPAPTTAETQAPPAGAAAEPGPAAAGPPPPPPQHVHPGWSGRWGRPRRRGWELIAVGLAGLLVGLVIGAGVTAVAALAVGHHRDGGYGWYNERRGPGGPGPVQRRPMYPGKPGYRFPMQPGQPQPGQPQPAQPGPAQPVPSAS